MKVKFIYRKGNYSSSREQVITRVCIYAALFIELPEEIEIELEPMGDSIYGETVLDPRFNKRIRINLNLSLKELVAPVIHELIHLHQIYKGRLAARRDGSYLWEGKVYNGTDISKMSYKDYKTLPWEEEAHKKQEELLEQILNKAL